MQNSDIWIRIKSFYGYQTSPVVLCMQIIVISTRNTGLYGFQPSSVVLRIQNRDFWSRITSLYRSQTSPVILCIQNSVISIRIASLYWSQPSSVDFIIKTAHYGPESLVSLGPRAYLSFCACKTA